MSTAYDEDVVAWAREQAALFRTGQFAQIDIEHIADEIEDVGRREQRELSSRMAVLLAHLLKWKFQPDRRGASWESTIHAQRNIIERRIRKIPSLNALLADSDWWADAWDDAVAAASKEPGRAHAEFPDACPWNKEQVIDHGFFPDTQDSGSR